MHIHNVYFWLKDDIDDQGSTAFAQGLKKLSTDPLIKHSHYGKPAGTHRGVVDNSYSYGLVFAFDNKDAHDRYQEGAVHNQFLQDHENKWYKVVVYDLQTD
jgi:hypothetical protein